MFNPQKDSVTDYLTTKGDLIAYTGTAPTRVAVTGNDGYLLTEDAASSGGVKFAIPASAPLTSYEISNLGLATSVAANALTIAVKQADGTTNPSTGASAVKVGFRSSTYTSGAYNQRSITSALSTTISSGSTAGQTSNKPWVIWIYLIDNAGTVEIAWSGSFWPESALTISTTAEGGAGAADNVSALYSTTARSNVPFRVIGKLTNTQTTAGTWTSAGTYLEVGNQDSLCIGLPPTVQTFNAGSTTYYTPAGCKRIDIEMVGAGGGGSVSGTASWNAGSPGTNTTTFGGTILVCNNGNGGSAASGGIASGGAGGTITINSPAIGNGTAGGAGGYGQYNGAGAPYLTGGTGGQSAFGGGGVGTVGTNGGNATANTGSGGGGGGGNSTALLTTGAGGGAGGYIFATIVRPDSSYAIVVGTGGAGGTPIGTNGYLGGAGSDGRIRVTEYYTN